MTGYMLFDINSLVCGLAMPGDYEGVADKPLSELMVD